MYIKIHNTYASSNSYLKDLEDNKDIILYSMQAIMEETYKIYQTDDCQVIVLFKAVTRKRKG